MDFFTAPTLTFGVLYCFFVIAHDRRRILHCHVTRHPTVLWITQQLREAFPYDLKHKYLIHDRDSKFGEAVSEALTAMGLTAMSPAFRSPWQNGVAERWVGSCRRELLDHVIPLGERHFKRLLLEYVGYYHSEALSEVLSAHSFQTELLHLDFALFPEEKVRDREFATRVMRFQFWRGTRFKDQPFVGCYYALHDEFSQPVRARDGDYIPEAGLGVQRKNHARTGQIRANHGHHAD